MKRIPLTSDYVNDRLNAAIGLLEDVKATGATLRVLSTVLELMESARERLTGPAIDRGVKAEELTQEVEA